MMIRDKALLHRRWNPSTDLVGRYIDTAALRVRFGKYDGAELQEIPGEYLRWCLDTLDLTRQERRAIQIRLVQEPFKSTFLSVSGLRDREGSLSV
jgi:hypothetical protein